MTIEETWQWITGPLVNGLYAEEYPIGVDDNGDAVPLPPNKTGNILFFNRLVGGARLRQVRYADDGCRTRRYVDVPELNGKYDTKDGTCFKEWKADSTSSHESDFIGYVSQWSIFSLSAEYQSVFQVCTRCAICFPVKHEACVLTSYLRIPSPLTSLLGTTGRRTSTRCRRGRTRVR